MKDELEKVAQMATLSYQRGLKLVELVSDLTVYPMAHSGSPGDILREIMTMGFCGAKLVARSGILLKRTLPNSTSAQIIGMLGALIEEEFRREGIPVSITIIEKEVGH